MSIETIAVGTDFSEAADLAAAQALHIARHAGASMALIHAAEVIEHDEDHPDLRRWGESAFRARRQALAEATERLSGQGVEIAQAVHDGPPAGALCAAAEELGAGLLVVGGHGSGGALERFLLGSTAERVIRLSRTPVLISRSRAGAGGFSRVLVAVDLSEESDRVIEVALDLTADGAELELFHLWQLPPGLAPTVTVRESTLITELRSTLSARAAEGLEQLLLRHRKPGVRLHYQHDEDRSPRDSILSRLEGGDYDLAVLGSHGRRGVKRWLAGSVAEGVARAAPCSVVVVKS